MHSTCQQCHDSNTLETTPYLCRLPPLLLIQLKRFMYSVNGKSRLGKQKINTYVSYPVEDLDVTDFVLPSLLEHITNPAETHYRLIGVVNHSGTADFGHYYAYCKDEYNRQDNWFEYNDTSVSAVRESEVVNKNAYLLLYRRSDLGSEVYSTISTMKITTGKRPTLTAEELKETILKMENERKLQRNRNDAVDNDRKDGVEVPEENRQVPPAKDKQVFSEKEKQAPLERDKHLSLEKEVKKRLSKHERNLLKKQMKAEKNARRK